VIQEHRTWPHICHELGGCTRTRTCCREQKSRRGRRVRLQFVITWPSTIRTGGGGCRGASGSPGPFGSPSSRKTIMAIRPSKQGRRQMLTVFFDMLLVLAAMIVWFVVSAAMVQPGP
jgi:hypothetical protein